MEIVFFSNGTVHWGKVVNFSRGGGRFTLRFKDGGTHPVFAIGQEIKCRITTRFGTSKCSGVVQWTRCVDDRLDWGMIFTDLSDDEDDPLYASIRHYLETEHPEEITLRTGMNTNAFSRREKPVVMEG